MAASSPLQHKGQQQQLLPPASADLLYATSLQAAMEVLDSEGVSPTIDSVFILGGEAVSETHTLQHV